MSKGKRITDLIACLVICGTLCGCASDYNLRNPFVKVSGMSQPRSSVRMDSPSVELKPEQKADVQLAMAQAMERQGKMEDATTLYMEAIKNDPDRFEAYYALALLHGKAGECSLADEHYRQAIDRAPENADLHCDFGYNLYLQQNWQTAEHHLRQSLSLQPDLQRAHNNLGMLLARTSREDEALFEFAQAGCSDAEARTNLALALTLSDQWQEAQQQYQMAIAADPQLELARRSSSILQSVSKSRQADFQPCAAPVPAAIAPASYNAPLNRPPLR